MAPQTRSTIKHSPGRSTRNSVYGRPPPPPSKPRKSTTTEVKSEVTPHVDNTESTPWLACRDAYGVMTTVALSETGEGVHIRWYYPDDDRELDEEEEAEVEMTVSEGRGVTPLTTSHAVRHPFPQTPLAPLPYDAGSVIRTPVKKAKPLQRSPLRIGDKGIRCLYEREGVLRELNSGARVVLRHPVGSSANLSREQVELLEKEREERIIQVQVKKLLEQKQRLQEEEECFSEGGYVEDEMEVDVPSSQLERQGTDRTFLISHGDLSDKELPTTGSASLEIVESTSGFCRGPNGELLDHQGRQMFGREGTVLMYPTNGSPRRIRREEAFVLSESWQNIDHSSLNDHPARACFGREGTELIA